MNVRCILVIAALANLACASVPGEGKFVRVASEEALIVWDEGAKREHFIRRASFDTDARDFGFLVPTPTRPELAESDDAAFDLLAGITSSAVLRHEARRDAPDAVTVLEQKRVAGLDAAVLEATDAISLDGWLKQHGYPSSPELVEWYAPYLAAQWKITAFKIAAGSPKVFSSAVRMSFQTERPFFPYREPATQRASASEPRLLRVYFIAEGRVDGTLGENSAWPGEAVWSKRLEAGELGRLLKAARLPSMAGGGARWLTAFEDRASPRPGTDEVFFRRAAANTPLERAAVSDWRVVAGAIIALIIGVLGLWAMRRSGRFND